MSFWNSKSANIVYRIFTRVGADADDEPDHRDWRKAGERVRDRMRSVGRRVMEIARITRFLRSNE